MTVGAGEDNKLTLTLTATLTHQVLTVGAGEDNRLIEQLKPKTKYNFSLAATFTDGSQGLEQTVITETLIDCEEAWGLI